jgi:phosphoadenosine phosphosulfate reductase
LVRAKSPSRLEYSPELAERLAQELEPLSAEELLRWAAEKFGDQLCLTCSWQKQSSALVHMLSQLDMRIDVIELDTELFFRETYALRDLLLERYGFTLIRPKIISVAEQHLQEGANLWERDPDRCCHIRKVEPLERALAPYGAWISGVRRDQSPSRAGLKKIQWSERYKLWRIHPFADWDEKRVWAYLAVNEVPYNPLHDMGYRSIGCIPCTRPTSPDEEERAGRWSGSDKLECGIHLDGSTTERN